MAGIDELDTIPPAEGEMPEEMAEGEKPVGPYQRDDESLLKWLLECFKEASEGRKEALKKRQESWKNFAGDQWDKADAKAFNDAKRPMLTLNMMLTIIAAVEGEERTNRQEMKFYGTGQEDDGAAYGLNRILKWIIDSTFGEFALSAQFRASAVSGQGWIVPEMDYFDDPEGLIKLSEVDDDEMFDDPLSTSPISDDSRYVHRARMFSLDEIEGRWPGSKDKITLQCAAAGIGPETDGKGYRDIYSTPNDTGSPKLYDAKKNMFSVMETWWSQIEPGYVVVNEQTGMLEEKTPEELEALKIQREREQKEAINAMMAQAMQPAPMAPMPGAEAMGPMMPPPPIQIPPAIQAKQRPIKRMYQAFWSNGVLLEKRASPLKGVKRAPYIPARAFWDKAKKEWFGLIWPIIDAQRQHNIEQSIIVQLMQLMPKQSWMAPKGAYHNKVQWQEGVAQPGKMLEYNGRVGKPEPIPVQPIPRHLIDMAFTRPATMREICGVNTDMMGQRVAGDPGVVMEMRQKAAKTVLAPIFDNYRMSKMALGKVLLGFIQTYIKPGRRIRIIGPEAEGQMPYVEMTDQMGLEKYDITVEETNSTVNDRIATLNILQTTLPQMMKAGFTVTPEFLDLMPMPPHVRNAWKRQVSWEMTLANRLPPPGWQPGQPIPIPGMPPVEGAPMEQAPVPPPAQ